MSSSINASAPLHKTTRSVLSLSSILDLKAYSSNPLEQPSIPALPSVLPSTSSTQQHASDDHDHDHSRPHTHTTPSPPHLDSITSVLLPLPHSLSQPEHQALLSWLQRLLWSPAEVLPEPDAVDRLEILRIKGIVWAAPPPSFPSNPSRQSTRAARRKGWVLQGVRGVYEEQEIEESEAEADARTAQGQVEGEGDGGKLVFIGKGLDGLEASLWKALDQANTTR